MGIDKNPIIKKIEDSFDGLKQFQKELQESGTDRKKKILLQYPTVYIHHWKDEGQYGVYIGESNDVVRRTKEHLAEGRSAEDWHRHLWENDASLYIIGHEYFHKSLTLDVENRLIHYMMGVKGVKTPYNMRGNPQNQYYLVDKLDEIFRSIWDKLQEDNEKLFPKESEVQDSAVFKASPFHKLTSDQRMIKDEIITMAFHALTAPGSHHLVFVEGEAGTGKTVLTSSTFYEIIRKADKQKIKDPQCYLVVNHEEQITVYEQIVQKLGITEKYGELVYRPVPFLNKYSKEEPVNLVFVDEAHLLFTQGSRPYWGKNQLKDIMERAKVTVIMFDENQILRADQYWEAQLLDRYRDMAKREGNYFVLKDQLRIRASKEVLQWIDAFTKDHILNPIPNDGSYEIRVFETPEKLESAIKQKARTKKHKLSRMIATYDWKYSKTKKPTNRNQKYWEVQIGKWHKPWNRELIRGNKKAQRLNAKLAWAEQTHTINEIGSTYTIQGFDLNYAGVILGPSVKYRDGKIILDSSASCNDKATNNRTLSDKTKRNFGERLIRNEVRVLLTRGVEGLYIYACDQELREALFEATKSTEYKKEDNLYE